MILRAFLPTFWADSSLLANTVSILLQTGERRSRPEIRSKVDLCSRWPDVVGLKREWSNALFYILSDFER